MAFGGLYNGFQMDQRISLETFRSQCGYKLGVDVEKGERLFGSREKAFYSAKWLNGNDSPIVLIERKGAESSDEILFNISLSHPHIIRTYGLVDPNGRTLDTDSVLLLQEYANNGDLGRLLPSKHFVPEQSVFVEIFMQIANAMSFLSQQGIIHGDLGCRNVLLVRSHPQKPKENLVKLIDFGLTKGSSKSSNANTDIPVRFVAPEILRSKGQSGYSEKSEVYAFAVFMHEACSFGKMPYEEINDDKDVWNQKLNGLKLTRPSNCDPNLWKLMLLCWNDQPEKRPTFQQICKQLEAIQNIESSQRQSNPPLFPIESQTCEKCQSRYTDHRSHTYTCVEEEITCEECFQEYRRGDYFDHQRSCNGDFDENRFTQQQTKFDSKLDVSLKSSAPPSVRPLSKITNSRDNTTRVNPYLSNSHFDFFETSDRQIISSKRPTPASDLLKRRNPAQTLRTNNQETSSRSNIDLIPCEICKKSYPLVDLRAHQVQCKRRDDERIERKRSEIERQNFTLKTECQYCQSQYSIEELDEHQKVCLANPENVPDIYENYRSPLPERSVSYSDIREQTRHSTRSNPEPRRIRESISVNSLNSNPEPPVKTRTQQSGLKKILSLFGWGKK